MAAAKKIDLFKDNKAEYASPKKPTLVETGPASYLAYTGKGDPADTAFQDAIQVSCGGSSSMNPLLKRS